MRTAKTPSALAACAARLLAATLLCAQAHAKGDDAIENQAVASLLSDLIRFDTTNPPGDTKGLANYLQAHFTRLGVPGEIILAPNGNAAHFFVRVKGDGSKKPILLAAHSDVVPANPATWSVPPFAGVIKDGSVWGRGALDNKGNLAPYVMAVTRLIQNKVRLSRDVILLAEADEEQGSFNTSWLAKNHWDKMDAEFSLNEGGTTLWDEEHRVTELSIGTNDKLTITFRMTATGPTGHSARPMPVNEMANGKLITAMARLLQFKQPIQIQPTVRAYLTALARRSSPDIKAAIKDLLAAPEGSVRDAAGERLIALDPKVEEAFAGLLRQTLVITMIESGLKANVIPGSASAVMNARLFPGASVDDFLGAIRTSIDDPGIELKVISAATEPDPVAYYKRRASVPPSTIDTDLYRALERAGKKQWPHVVVTPTLMTGTGDSSPWRERGIPVYSVSAAPVHDAQRPTIHGDDEHVSVNALGQGTRFIYDVLVDVAGRKN